MNTVYLLLFGSLIGICHSRSFQLYTNQIPGGTNDLSQANPSDRTIILIHGWQQSSLQPWIIDMKNKYISNYQINFITLDWSDESNSLYDSSAKAVPGVGVYLGKVIYQWNANGTINANKTKIIGFSLGAHVAGFAGQEYQLQSSGSKLPQIDGLEAAADKFDGKPNNERLDKTDAVIVQAFHTSTLGIHDSYGSHDVYFNGVPFADCGREQPGCPLNPGVTVPSGSVLPYILCDHIRAAPYYIESVHSNSLVARLCSCNSFILNTCRTTGIVVGEGLLPTAPPGKYYLSTACKAPFALGTEGLKYSYATYICI